MRKNRARKLMYTAGLVGVIGAAAALGGCSSSVQIPDTVKVEAVDGESDTIMVTGEEEVRVVPDMAEIVYSVYTQAKTAAECQEENSKNLDQTIETLKGLGVEEKSIQTSSFGLDPIRNWNSGTQEVTGYSMRTQLTVSDIPLEQAGTILSQSVTSGVNQIDSVGYFASSYDEKYQEALKGAVAMAQKKAEALAEASQKSVVGVSHVEEFGYNPQVRYTNYDGGGFEGAAMETAAGAGARADMSVMPGEITVEASVNVTFTIE